MKKILLSLCLFALLTSCKKSSTCDQSFYSGNNNYMQMLQVGYTNYAFMGGKSFFFSSSNINVTSIPLSMIYHTPSDFGDITFIHTPTHDTVFSGTIFWNGCGQINFPRPLDPVPTFCTQSAAIACPDSSRFEMLGPNARYAPANTINYSAIWGAISHLGVTSYMMQHNCKIGIYPYTPSVGIGDPNQWSWIIFLYR